MEEDNCKQHGKEKANSPSRQTYIIVIGIVAVIFAMVWDSCKDLPCFSVSESYLDQIFTALCTLAVLGPTMQSVIVGAYQYKFLGFTVRELLNYLPNQPDLMYTIWFSFLAVGIAMICLAAKLYTTMTVLTVCVIILIGESFLDIWKLLTLSDEEDLVKELQAGNKISLEVYYAKWFPEVQQALTDGDEEKSRSYIDLIRSISQTSNEKSENILQAHARAIFPDACDRLGFVDAFKLILLLNDWTFNGLDSRAVATDYINQIRFCPDNELFKYRIASTVDDIFERLNLDDDDKIYYAYRYYWAIEQNTVAGDAVRREIIVSLFEKLCFLYEKGTGSQRERVILYVARHILETEDVPDRQMQWDLLIGELYQHRYSHDKCYIGVIAQIFRALYFYCHFETETLQEEFREGLVKLCTFSRRGKETNYPSLNKLVLQKKHELLKWFSEDLKEQHFGINMFDYFPAYDNGKTVVWDVETCTYFAFWFYLLVGYPGGLFPYEIHSDSLNKNDISVCIAIVSNFNEQENLSENAGKKVQMMKTFLQAEYSLEGINAKRNFQYFNHALADIRKKENEERNAAISEDINKMNINIIEQLKKFEGVQYSQDISLTSAKRITLAPHISRNAMYGVENRAYYISNVISLILNDIIKKSLRTEKLWFGKDSIYRMYTLLSGNEYKYTDYLYTDDWGFSQEIRSSDKFEELKSLISKMELIPTRDLQHMVFLCEPIRFNAHVDEYALREPTDDQCEKFVDQYKVADGKYRIDGVLYSHTQAIDCARTFKTEYCVLSIATNVDAVSGFQVELDRKVEITK